MRLLLLIIVDLTITNRKSTLNNRILQQIYLLIVDTDLRSTPKFHSTGHHYEKNFTLKKYILQSLLWNKCNSAKMLVWQT